MFYNSEKRLVVWWASANELLTICCTSRAVSPLFINFDKKVKNRVKNYKIFLDYDETSDSVAFVIGAK